MEKALEILEMIKKDLDELIENYSDDDYAYLVTSLMWHKDLLEICLKWLKEGGKQYDEERKAE